MNLTIITGYIGMDARTTTMSDGTNAINFSVADSYQHTDRTTGEITEKTTWIDCSYYRESGKSIEVAKHLLKGTLVCVRGKVSASVFENSSGKHIPVLKLYVENIELLAKPKEKQNETQQQVPENTNEKDDLPF